MNLKKKLKKFFAQNRSNDGGFTLVELIVVIAILGILAGVGTVGYSGYIKKANMAADQQLIGQVKTALELYYYSNPETATAGYVILDKEGTVYVAGDASSTGHYNEVGDKAMIAAFGENWKDSTFLKYGDWEGDTNAASYGKTSYYGSEKKLLGDVEGLTGALGAAIKDMPTLVGPNFADFLGKYNLSVDNDADIDAIADAAVLYVADQTVGKGDMIQTAVETALAGSVDQFANNMITDLVNQGMNDVAALAVVYASIEGLAQANEKTLNVNLTANPGETMNATLAAQRLDAAYQDMLAQCGNDAARDYIDSTKDNNIYKDLTGYVGMMSTVSQNKNLVDGNLGQQDTFTNDSLVNTIRGYAGAGALGVTTNPGQVAVVLTEDGIVQPIPVNWNK